MNERILQFAEQAGSTHKQNLGVYQFYTNELEKFAELIIKECLEQVRDDVQYASDWQLADAVSNRVLEHFGVEE